MKVQEKKHKHSKHSGKLKKTRKVKHQNANSIRGRRSVSQPHYVETAIVADISMVEFHENNDIDTYILTLMNMVSRPENALKQTKMKYCFVEKG